MQSCSASHGAVHAQALLLMHNFFCMHSEDWGRFCGSLELPSVLHDALHDRACTGLGRML